MIFDTHAHYNDSAFEEDREELLTGMKDRGIGRIVNVAADIRSLDEVTELAERYSFCYAAVGIHPEDCALMTEETLEAIRRKLRLEKTVAVGEIGLDYHYDEPERELQQYWFRKQLELAAREKAPVIIHSRDAAEDTYEILREFADSLEGGVIHCFSYSRELALDAVRMGFYIGVGGVVTYKNGRKLKEVVQAIPLERIVLETDCPYLSPAPHRGERNHSGNLPLVIAEIAALKEIPEEEVVTVTERNAEKLYRL